MSTVSFVATALLVSGFVWYLNFSADRSTWRGIAVEEINRGGSAGAGAPLEPQPGGRHMLVTGGAGFIGSHAALALLDGGHAVTVIDNLSRGNLGALRKVWHAMCHGLAFNMNVWHDASGCMGRCDWCMGKCIFP